MAAYGSTDFLWGSSTSGCASADPIGVRRDPADIHVNPPSPRYNFADGYNQGENVFFYQPTMLHEMGHALALETESRNEDYQFDRTRS